MRTDHDPTRICPSCRIRHRLNAKVSPNLANAVPISKEVWKQIRQLAECFDLAASSLDEEEWASGAGDGRTMFTAAEFVEWLKADCLGFEVKPYHSDGSPAAKSGTVARQPFELPQAGGDWRKSA